MNILKVGMNNNTVKVLLKYLGIEADGDFGKQTESKVKEFQSNHNLTADGIVGNTTWKELIKDDLKHDYLTDADYIMAAIELNVDLAAIKAVKTVESGGKWQTNGVPTMLFEGHVFWKELQAKGINPKNYIKGNEDIIYPSWIKTYYKADQYKRLQKAIKINEDAAYRSASYGLFQIMGNNCKLAGFNSAKSFYDALAKNEDAHLSSFITFIKNSKLTSYLQKKDWAGFAKRYNGAGYKSNNYDKKLEAAYKQYN